ncbi:glycoside hydrolase family 57 protein [Inmirania thermothiophila]|uniref:Alpha-amylase/alpha-mannosidase (GH57 family) n=1 Tax=Inmirania thermothiophila TaxID=1750597 RepID=A0A3N1Y1V9_9GAMM|nr:glycoside hydrolase family 57 protein [Inmirania thermothiophila]ROR32814.1 alpha-amylase/alpha-mannosidase (GH57 family) [Inmirania thermothiophila]
MSRADRLPVVFLWHMHQPCYRDPEDGRYHQPWTYLHGIKDYTDMAAHLEAHEGMRAVVNFAPVLLDQLAEYAEAVAAHLHEGAPLPDPLLAALAEGAPPAGEAREAVVRACLRANEHRMIARFPAYARMVRIAREALAARAGVAWLGDAFVEDLVVWYHLAWMGEAVRRADPRLRDLMAREGGFGAAERRLLLERVGEQLAGIPGRYRRLWEAGRVELAASPWGHPMLPLLLDFAAAREAWPEAALPASKGYPGGEARVRWHLAEARRAFARHFGREPAGCWPSEGGVSEAALRLVGEAGFRWAASGEGVLRNSLGGAPEGRDWVHRGYRHGTGPALFFRDDGLSDLIGFQYAAREPAEAVADLVGHLENIDAATAGRPGRVVAVILDGENAWEHYAENGFPFLDRLYGALEDHPRLRPATFEGLLEEGLPLAPLGRVVAGSWVYGTFSTWMGDPDKNRAWDALVAAKQAFDEAAPALGGAAREDAVRRLAVCEGSDWFWWYGDYNPPEAVRDFDALYRHHLAALYRALGREVPQGLAAPLGEGHGAPAGGGTMRPGREGA